MPTNTKSSKKTFIIGAVSILLLTLLYRATSIFVMIIEMSSMYSYELLSTILQIVRDVLELSVYATGIALVITFVRIGNKKYRNLAYIAVLLILFLDYGVAFAVDFAVGSIDGYALFTAIYLVLNIVVRAAFYALTAFFAGRIMLSSTDQSFLPIPFISKTNPSSRMLITVFVIRILPYLLFEIYSNITGIIEYGFDMSGADILSIISAYAEIILSSVIVYIFAYLFLVLFIFIYKKSAEKAQ